MGHNGNANSLKNLERGRWVPGQSGNPTGRAKGVIYPSELLHGLLAMDDDGTPKYTRGDLEKIVEDENAAPALVIAARWILDGMRDGQRWVVGKDGKLQPAALDPTPSRVRVELADRLEGKPVQKIAVQQTPTPTPQECEDAIVATIEAHAEALSDPAVWPALVQIIQSGGPLLERLRPVFLRYVPRLLESAESVDVEAIALPTTRYDCVDKFPPPCRQTEKIKRLANPAILVLVPPHIASNR